MLKLVKVFGVYFFIVLDLTGSHLVYDALINGVPDRQQGAGIVEHIFIGTFSREDIDGRHGKRLDGPDR